MTAGGDNLEQWDLTSKISPFLDRHMMFPLLHYLDELIDAGTINYASKDVAAARLALLRPTHMVDYAIDTYKAVHGNGAAAPKEMEEQKNQVFKQREELENSCKPLSDLCNNEEEKVRRRVVVLNSGD
jgi:translation initiation factor 3 subunit E